MELGRAEHRKQIESNKTEDEDYVRRSSLFRSHIAEDRVGSRGETKRRVVVVLLDRAAIWTT